jgi:putative transposase
MARPPRLSYENALYHVTCRGNGRQDIFLSDENRKRFLEQLQDGLRTHGVVLLAYVLMTNHYHLLVRTPRANLSRFMQRLNTSYSLYFRYKHRRPGHAFQGRFKAKVVAGDPHLLALTRYIHLNPVKIRKARTWTASERVRYLNAYRWSSYPGYARGAWAREWICYEVLAQYGRNLAEARRRYRAYTEAMVMNRDDELQAVLLASRHALGDADFIARTERELSGRSEPGPRSSDVDLPRQCISLDLIDQTVARHYGVEPGHFKWHGIAAGPGKGVAVELAARLSGKTQREIGTHYGRVSAQAVAMVRRNIRQGGDRLGAIVDDLEKALRSSG